TISATQDEVRVLSAASTQPKKQPQRKSNTAHRQVTRSSVGQELDIRGMTCDEGVAMVERFLDSAVMAHLTGVSIIHGKGTGVLRQAVHQYLKTCKYVKRYRLGRFGEGEDGVTVVELK
ncbi:MAG: Smr/MutS family protein, partial [Clostridiales bacterium]|nr:Smr/MutS family protein [Clostridiales bacterium]